MKAFSVVFNLLALVLIMLFGLYYINVCKVDQRDFDQARLNIAIDNATEALIREAVRVKPGASVFSIDAIEMDGTNALDAFSRVMCLSYGMSISEENYQAVQDCIASAVLVSSSGYHIAKETSTVVNGYTQRVTKWSPKIPYIIKVGNMQYGIDFGNGSWIGINTGTRIASISPDNTLPASVTEKEVLTAVNNQILKDMVNETKAKNYNRSDFKYSFYLPSETTVDGVNPIEGPSVLVLMQNVHFASIEKIDAMAVSGFKVVEKKRFVGFSQGGKKWYCYEGQLDPALVGTKYSIDEYYPDMATAAAAGYSPHLMYLTKEIKPVTP